MIRSFIAIHLPDETRDEFRRVQWELKGAGADVKWVRPESVHLTLKFLGNISEDLVNPLSTTLETKLRGLQPIHLEVADTGVFPNWKKIRVVWLGLGGDLSALFKLQSAVEEATAEHGIEPERRPFKPHLTLGRIRSGYGQGALISTLRKTKTKSIPFIANEVILFQSVLQSPGALYTPLHRIAL